MELRDYLRVLRKRWRLVALLPLLALLAAAVVTIQATPQYQSSTTFFVSTPATAGGDSSAAYSGSLFSQQRVKSYADLLSGDDLASAVRADLQSTLSSADIASRIAAQVTPDTVLLRATVTDTSPDRARSIATSLGRQFPGLVERLERPATGGVASIRAIVVEPPKVAEQVSPRPLRNLGLALVLGLLLGVGLAVARETLDSTVKTPEDVRLAAGVATLGAIGFDSKITKRPLVVQDEPRAPRAEAFRQLRTNLQFVGVDQGLRSVVITSSLPGEAKSTTACNLAITLAQSGVKVLLVEGDLRRPRVADYLGIEGSVGLTSVLIGQVELSDVLQAWGDAGLDVLASGPLPPNPAELLGSAGMRALMRQLEDTYDIVVVDAPPLLPVTDAAVIATMTSGALLCVRAGKTRREQLTRAAEALDAVGARTLGALLTMVPRRGPDAYYSYGYGEYRSDHEKLQLSDADAQQATRPSTRTAADAPRSVQPEASSRRTPADAPVAAEQTKSAAFRQS